MTNRRLRLGASFGAFQKSSPIPACVLPAPWDTSTKVLTWTRSVPPWRHQIFCSRSSRTSTAPREFASWSSTILKTSPSKVPGRARRRFPWCLMRSRRLPNCPCSRSFRPFISSAISPSAWAGSPTTICIPPRSSANRRSHPPPQELRDMRLKDKVAIVTGAASGIAKEIARAYAREGARVVIADLNQTAADAIAAELGGPLKALAVAMDVTNEQQVEAGVARTIEQFGKIDVLVSNAGIQIVAPLDEFEFASWKKLLAIHLDGAFLTTRAVLQRMYKQRTGGSIIYMGSVHSKEASVLKAPYVTAKHGLIGLAKVVAKEGAKHSVRANVICPGFVRTPLVDKQIPEQAKELGISEDDVIRKVMLKDTVDGQFTTVQDVAEVALLFASFPTSALTGQSLIVSHGWSME